MWVGVLDGAAGPIYHLPEQSIWRGATAASSGGRRLIETHGPEGDRVTPENEFARRTWPRRVSGTKRRTGHGFALWVATVMSLLLAATLIAGCGSPAGRRPPHTPPAPHGPSRSLAWSAPQTIDPPGPGSFVGSGSGVLTSVSCVSPTFCAAVDNTGNAVTWNGSSWSAVQLIDSGGELTSVSCTSSSFCMAAGIFGDAFLWNGSSWSTAQLFESTLGTVGYVYTYVSCASSRFCALVDINGNAVTWNGKGWSAPQSIDPDPGFTSVSCRTSRFCVAVDGDGNAFTWNGSSWSPPQLILSSGDNLASVSCSSSRFCAAVDSSVYAYTWRGTGWSAPQTIVSISGLTAVSCSGSRFCVAVDATFASNAITWNGIRWSAPQPTYTGSGAGLDLTSVSCASSSFCVAVGGFGSAVTWR